MSFGPELLAARLWPLAAAGTPLRCAVALSGGADSAALLHAAAALAAADARLRVRALHVDHGLGAAAGPLAAAAAALAARCGVPMVTLPVSVAASGGDSVEAAARAARYAALAAALEAGEWLLTAHHREDQAETLLLQLVRGAGLRGLASMPESAPLGRGRLVRPVLDVAHAALLEYARAAGLSWHEDPMNADPRYERAFLRTRLWPLIAARWPAAGATLARAAAHLASAQSLLDEDSAKLLATVARGPGLAIDGLLGLPAARRAELLRYWFAMQGLRSPATRRLERVEDELLRAGADGEPRMAWAGAELRAFDAVLYAFAPLPALPARQPAPLAPAATSTVDLGGLGRLVSTPRAGAGLAVAHLGEPLELRRRAGGERLRRHAGGRRRPLKDLLREARLPPWARARVPLLYAGEELLAVVLPEATWVAAEHAAEPGEPGLVLEWQGAPAVLQPTPAARGIASPAFPLD